MKNSFVITLFIMLFFVNPIFANVYDKPVNISTFIDELPKMSSITCEFKQEKHLKNISKPIISGGNFKFIKDKGVYFETLYPIKSTVSYTDKDYKQINNIIVAISNKKYSKLEKEFAFYFLKEKNTWTLGLKPKANTQTSNYINHITITGTNKIDKINISLMNGNSTVLWFFK